MRAFPKERPESSRCYIRPYAVRFCVLFLLAPLGIVVWAQNKSEIPELPEPKYGIRLQKSVMISMRDGVRLATDLYFPEGAPQPLPVVLIRTPYNKKLLRPERASGYYRWKGGDIRVRLFAGQGYVVAVQDLRGRYESEGVWRVGSSERDDGSDTLDWIAAQPWSSGKVGTYGCSYLGEDQLQLSATRNPHQLAAIPQGAGGAYTGTHRTFGFMDGGAFELATAIGWFPREGSRLFYRAPAGTADSIIADTSDLFVNGPALPSVDYQKVFWWLPLIDIMKRIGGPPTYYEDFVSHSPDDPYWQGFTTSAIAIISILLHSTSTRGMTWGLMRPSYSQISCVRMGKLRLPRKTSLSSSLQQHIVNRRAHLSILWSERETLATRAWIITGSI